MTRAKYLGQVRTITLTQKDIEFYKEHGVWDDPDFRKRLKAQVKKGSVKIPQGAKI
jgi:hypothetical protein